MPSMYSKFLKLLIILFCILCFFACILNIKMANTIYIANKQMRNFLNMKRLEQLNTSWKFIDSANQEKKYTNSIEVQVTTEYKSESENDNYAKISLYDIMINKLSHKYDIFENETIHPFRIGIISQRRNDDSEIVKKVNNGSNTCPDKPSDLAGPIELNLTNISLQDVDNKKFGVDIGGHFVPKYCVPYNKVAIIIPYRDREGHLAVFLNNMHTFLMKQGIEYQIFVIEQTGNDIFNRAILKNIGYVESNNHREWDCYIFHDVDLLPLDDRNFYNCSDQPRHMSVAVDKFDFRLPYEQLSGGVLALTTDQFQTINGFSNNFWGWGGEDDDMSNRLKYHGYTLMRYPTDIARYAMLDHEEDEPNPHRFEFLDNGKDQFDFDGLSNLQYSVIEMQMYNTYTLYLVDINTPNYSYDILMSLIKIFIEYMKQ